MAGNMERTAVPNVSEGHVQPWSNCSSPRLQFMLTAASHCNSSSIAASAG